MFCITAMLGLMSKGTESSKTKHKDLCLHLWALERIYVQYVRVFMCVFCREQLVLGQIDYHSCVGVNITKLSQGSNDHSSDDIFLLANLSKILTSFHCALRCISNKTRSLCKCWVWPMPK